jgi:hypothetical protein
MRLTLTHGPEPVRALLLLAVLWLPLSVQAQTQEDPLSKRGWHLELTVHGALETWNYNDNHEEMLAVFPGFTYAVREGLAVKIAFPLYRVWQRGTDAYLFGTTWGVRGRFTRKARWSAFWEAEVGVSEADTYVPPRGTRFNYVASGGGGLTIRIRPGIHALAGMRWVHVSNNGLAGRSRNPDIEAVGPTVGMLFGF